MGNLRHLRLFGLALVLASAGLGDTLTLKNGTVVEGTYLGGTARVIRMAVGDGVQSFGIDTVAGLQFGGGGGERSSRPGPGPGQADSRPVLQRPSSSSDDDARPVVRRSASDNDRPVLMRPDSDQSSSSTSSSSRGPSGMEIPSGTQITVRMIDSVDSQVAHLGDTFRASVDEPVYVDNQPVIPRGADVIAKLVEDQQSGKIAGKTVLKLALTSIKVGDRMVDVTTQDIVRESSSRGARSGKVIGGTAALGAIIGGIAGGGRGAAIGAGSGAAVGTGAQELGKGQRVQVPSETRLVFTLAYPAHI
ncbi:MAG: hypothetical protein JWO80_2412 [Bryobacterales bacterium]|nr:hypothetical protein [Bryobacterales bacterium]